MFTVDSEASLPCSSGGTLHFAKQSTRCISSIPASSPLGHSSSESSQFLRSGLFANLERPPTPSIALDGGAMKRRFTHADLSANVGNSVGETSVESIPNYTALIPEKPFSLNQAMECTINLSHAHFLASKTQMIQPYPSTVASPDSSGVPALLLPKFDCVSPSTSNDNDSPYDRTVAQSPSISDLLHSDWSPINGPHLPSFPSSLPPDTGAPKDKKMMGMKPARPNKIAEKQEHDLKMHLEQAATFSTVLSHIPERMHQAEFVRHIIATVTSMDAIKQTLITGAFFGSNSNANYQLRTRYRLLVSKVQLSYLFKCIGPLGYCHTSNESDVHLACCYNTPSLLPGAHNAEPHLIAGYRVCNNCPLLWNNIHDVVHTSLKGFKGEKMSKAKEDMVLAFGKWHASWMSSKLIKSFSNDIIPQETPRTAGNPNYKNPLLLETPDTYTSQTASSVLFCEMRSFRAEPY